MDKLDLAFISFKALLKDIKKEELNLIVKKIDDLDNSSNSYLDYLNCLDREFSFMFEDFWKVEVSLENFHNFELVDCESEIIEYNNQSAFFHVLVEDFEIDFNIQSEETYPLAA